MQSLTNKSMLALLFLFCHLSIGSCQDNCSATNCSIDGPQIRFPFWLKGSDQHCGYPGFEVACNGNNTVLRLPSSSRDVFIRSINYKDQRVDVFNPDNCRAALLFNLNLSGSPFYYYGDRNSFVNITMLDCSNSSQAERRLCTSTVSGHIMGFTPSDTYLDGYLRSCEMVETVEYPMNYTGRLYYGDGDDVRLGWDEPSCKSCESHGRSCRFINITTQDVGCNHQGLSVKNTIIGVSICFVFLVVATIVVLKMYHSRKLSRMKEVEDQLKIEKFLEDYKSLKPTRYSYADVKRMTDQFKNKLGQGGCGTVFKGNLPNGTPVAVKILKALGGDGLEFINEVATIGQIHHVNVVRLLGFCSGAFKRALIYEFMPNESLEKFIFSRNGKSHGLAWEKLREIAIGIARGIEYLHQGCDQRILHFDIKPHNILVDHNFNPKISDFGLAKLCTKGKSIVSMTAARGTVGYIAPEVFSRNIGNVSYKSDVYSFGMLLLEMVGGRKKIDATTENTSQMYFPDWIYSRLERGEDLGLGIVDDEEAKIAKQLTIVGTWCIQWYPVNRPSITSVLQMLEGSVESLTIGPYPFASSASTDATTALVEEQHSINLTVISEEE